MNLPFVKDELITEFGNRQVDFRAIHNNLKSTNPFLLDYIVNFPNYLKDSGKPISREAHGYLVNMSLSVCALLGQAAANNGLEPTEQAGFAKQSLESAAQAD